MGHQEMSEAQAEATPKPLRRRRASVGGFKTKLDAPQREGYVRRWVDDSPNRIAAMQELGYDYATDRAAEGAKRTDGLGTRISRMAGKRDDGSPHHLVLMETPVEEYQAGVADKEDQLKPFEEALKAGADTTGRLQDAYQPQSGSSLNHQRA
jgi:hypothetical protein